MATNKADIRKIKEGQLLNNDSDKTIFPITLGKAVWPETILGITKNLDKVLLDKCGYATLESEYERRKYKYHLRGFADFFSATAWNTFRDYDSDKIPEKYKDFESLKLFDLVLGDAEDENLLPSVGTPIAYYYDTVNRCWERISWGSTITTNTIPLKINMGWIGDSLQIIIDNILADNVPNWYLRGNIQPTTGSYFTCRFALGEGAGYDYVDLVSHVSSDSGSGEFKLPVISSYSMTYNSIEERYYSTGGSFSIYPNITEDEVPTNTDVKSRVYFRDEPQDENNRIFPDCWFDVCFTNNYKLTSPTQQKFTDNILCEDNNYKTEFYVRTSNATEDIILYTEADNTNDTFTLDVLNPEGYQVQWDEGDHTKVKLRYTVTNTANQLPIELGYETDSNNTADTSVHTGKLHIVHGNRDVTFNIYKANNSTAVIPDDTPADDPTNPGSDDPESPVVGGTIVVGLPYDNDANPSGGVASMKNMFKTNITLPPGASCVAKVIRVKSNSTPITANIHLANEQPASSLTLVNDTEESQTYIVIVDEDSSANYKSVEIRLLEVNSENYSVVDSYNQPLTYYAGYYYRVILGQDFGTLGHSNSYIGPAASQFIHDVGGNMLIGDHDVPPIGGEIVVTPGTIAQIQDQEDNIDLASIYILWNRNTFTEEEYAAMTSIEVPYYIFAIGKDCFKSVTTLETVTFEDDPSNNRASNCMSISIDAFRQCTNLSSVALPSSLTYIGSNAFDSCINLTTLDLPENLKVIGKYAFKGSGLTSIIIPNTVDIIKEGTFATCRSLKTMWIKGHSITSKLEIEADAFSSDGSDKFALEDVIIELPEPPSMTYSTIAAFKTKQTNIYVPNDNILKYKAALSKVVGESLKSNPTLLQYYANSGETTVNAFYTNLNTYLDSHVISISSYLQDNNLQTVSDMFEHLVTQNTNE